MLPYNNHTSFFKEDEDINRTYWGNEAAGCIFIAKDTGRILLAHRSNRVKFEPNTWGTWGGKIDFEETPKETIAREVEEETGFSEKYKINHLYTYEDGGFKYYNYIVVVPFEFTPQLNWENDNSKWVEYGEWPNPLHFGMEALLQHAGGKIKRIIDLLKKKNKTKIKEADVVPPKPAAQIQPHVSTKTSSNKVLDNKKIIDAYVVVATLWGEARGEGVLGMQAVLNVIMNRAGGDFNKAKDVCLKPKQFSIWNNVPNPENKTLELLNLYTSKKMRETKQFQIAVELVSKAMNNNLPDITGGATFYFNPKKVIPSWAKSMIKLKSIGNHDFYKLASKPSKKSVKVAMKEDISKTSQGLVDDGVYGYELKSEHSYLRYGHNPTNRIFYLYNIGTPNQDDKNKGYATELLKYFFQLIKQSNGMLDAGSYTTSGMAYIKHVVDRLSKEYNVRLL